jgi:hypothetical protein
LSFNFSLSVMSQKPAFIGNSSYPVLSFGLFDIHEIVSSAVLPPCTTLPHRTDPLTLGHFRAQCKSRERSPLLQVKRIVLAQEPQHHS